MKMTKAESFGAVERERERESYSLFNMEFVYSTTYTGNLLSKEGENTFINNVKRQTELIE